MALSHQSIATISSPEFINLQPLDINPLMSKCEIKVLYLGANRNQSYITKDVATEMAKTLRGAPIVGYYKESEQDFADHGHQIIFDDEGIHFNCLTKPYGFVSPDAKVWFQDFQDQDEFNNSIIRTYLMTTGYLWTGQFAEAQQVIDDNGKPQSMELDEKSLQGHWSTDVKKDMEFFIINDAIFSKLCILGNSTEPCFEGASITKPEVSASFTLDNDFKQTLFNMMQELTYALKGGNKVEKVQDENVVVQQNDLTEENTFSEKKQDKNDQFELNKNNNMQNENNSEVFEKKDKEEDESAKEEDESDSENQDDDANQNEEDDDAKKKKYSKLDQDFEELQNKYTQLESELNSLRSFKQQVEDQQKDALIAEFYMLSDEDKKEIMDNKSQYTLDEIKSKLAVICFEKKVNFNLNETASNQNEKKDENPVTTFNVEIQEDSTPDWVKEVESVMKL